MMAALQGRDRRVVPPLEGFVFFVSHPGLRPLRAFSARAGFSLSLTRMREGRMPVPERIRYPL